MSQTAPVEQKLELKTPEGIRLAAVLCRPGQPTSSGVVICHGMLSSKDSPKHVGIAARMGELGHMVLRFDFSGRGESQGDLMRLTFSRQVAECRVAISYLRRLGCARLALVGSSMGGAVAVLAAAGQGDVIALATLAAVGCADRLPERVVGDPGVALWRRKGSIRMQGHPVGWALVEDARRIDVPSAAARVNCPWLILHGAEDQTIPVSDAKILHEASGGRSELEIVPRADHSFSQAEHREQVISRIVTFLHDVLSQEIPASSLGIQNQAEPADPGKPSRSC